MKKNLKNSKGITLISLVVTIIVLLILAGISVTMITSNNGILTRAKEAKEQTVIGQEKESVELAYITATMKKLGDNVTSEELQHELDLSVGANKTQVAGQDILQVYFTETEHSYEVENGTVTRTEIFDANDGFYIGEGEEKDKVSLKLYVPKKDAIVSDIILKGFVPQLESYDYYYNYFTPQQGLCSLSKYNNDYLDALEDLDYIDNNMKQFIKTEFLNTATDSSFMNISGTPMFKIQQVDDKYYLVMEWDYCLDKDDNENNNNTVLKNAVRISSEITFTNNFSIDSISNMLNGISNGFDSIDDIENFRDTFRNFANEFNSKDYTKYTLGDLKVEKNIYECSATESVPIKNIIPSTGETITNFSFIYNNKEYENKEGLKEFLDNILGFKNKDIITTYIMMSCDQEEELLDLAENIEIITSMSDYYQIPVQIAENKVQNADILTKYLKDSNKLDGLYVKGQRITSKLQYDEFDSIKSNDEEDFDEREFLEQYMSRLLQLWRDGILGNVKYFKVFLDKQIIDPVILNTMVNSKMENIDARVKNLQIGNLVYEDGEFTIPSTWDITGNKTPLGEIFDYAWNLHFEVGVSLSHETSSGIEFNNLSLNPEMVSALFYHWHPDESNFEWDYFRKKGLTPLNENILQFPDKIDIWKMYEENKNKLPEWARDNHEKWLMNNHPKQQEIDAYILMYRLVIYDAIMNGEYEIKNDGKTYTGTKAFENFLREEYGLNRNKLQEYIDAYNENNY